MAKRTNRNGCIYHNLEDAIEKDERHLYQIANSAGMSVPSIINKRRGMTDWTLDECYRLRDILGLQNIQIEELFRKFQ